MAKFHYKALKHNTAIEVQGVLEAENPVEARAKLKELGFLPTYIFEETHVKPDIEPAKSITFLGLSDKILFTSELSVMFASGISVTEALETAELHAPKPKIKQLANDLKMRILKGATFTEALKAYEKVFGGLYIALCEAGENAGTLDKSMEYLTIVLKKQEALKGKIISISVYPIFLIILLIGVFILCGKYIFPAFVQGANMNPSDIPVMVKLVTVPCGILFANWFSIILTAVLAFFAGRFLWLLQNFRDFWDRQLLKLPKVNDWVRYINLSSYFTVMHVAYEAGIPISAAMNLAANTLSNSVIESQAANSERMVSNGQMISRAFSISQLVPPVLNVLIASGEKAGRLGEMFKDTASAIDKNLETATEILTRSFEPVLLVIIGAAVGYVAIAFVQMYSGFISSLF